MNEGDVAEWFSIVMSLSPECAERDELGAAVNAASRLESFLSHYKVRCKRRADALAAEGRSESGFGLIAGGGHQSTRDAQAAVDRDRVCTDLPQMDSALASGAVSGDHVDLVAKHTKNLTDAERSELLERGAEIADAATTSSTWSFDRHMKDLVGSIKANHRPQSDVEELERQRAASKISRRTDSVTGMKTTVIDLDPIRDQQLHNLVDAELAKLKRLPEHQGRPFQAIYVEAFMNVVTRRAADTSEGSIDDVPSAGGVAEVILHIDGRSCAEGRHAHTMSETQDGDPVPVSTVQRYCCEAMITAVVVNPDGSVTRLSEERTANRRQRRALAAMYATCAHPDCQVPFSRCRVHHVVWWSRGGATVLANLLPVCEQHHHLLHEGGWSVEMDDDRTVRWKRPDGSLWREHHSPNRRRRRAA